MTTILDPTNEQVPVERQLSPRLGEITGRLAMLDISNQGAIFSLIRLRAGWPKDCPT